MIIMREREGVRAPAIITQYAVAPFCPIHILKTGSLLATENIGCILQKQKITDVVLKKLHSINP